MVQEETTSLSQTYDPSSPKALADGGCSTRQDKLVAESQPRLYIQHLIRVSRAEAATATGPSLRPVTVSQRQVKKSGPRTILETQTIIQEEQGRGLSTCKPPKWLRSGLHRQVGAEKGLWGPWAEIEVGPRGGRSGPLVPSKP